ncbi:hypothetical protein BGX28_009377 [Mortierella sp. GBA30]|nr:hypothetical protein BGX28_009377 [Mortierella sp. GBA30]
MRVFFAALAASFIGAVMAQQAYPTAPVANTTWNSPSNVTVQWKLNTPPATTGLAVDLFKGDDPTHQTLVKNLGTGKPGATSLKVQIPAKLASGWYSIRIGDSYSHPFVIKGTGPVPTGPAPTTGPSNSGGVPTATGGGNWTSTATGTKTSLITPTQSPNHGNHLSSTKPMALAAALMAVLVVSL